jgi:hypothetical protein
MAKGNQNLLPTNDTIYSHQERRHKFGKDDDDLIVKWENKKEELPNQCWSRAALSWMIGREVSQEKR